MRKFINVSIVDALAPLLALAWFAVFRDVDAIRVYGFTPPTPALALVLAVGFRAAWGWSRSLAAACLRKTRFHPGVTYRDVATAILLGVLTPLGVLVATSPRDGATDGLLCVALGAATGFALSFKLALSRRILTWLALFLLAWWKLPPSVFAPTATAAAAIYGGAITIMWGLTRPRRRKWLWRIMALLSAWSVFAAGNSGIEAGMRSVEEFIDADSISGKFADAAFVALLPGKPVVTVAFSGENEAMRTMLERLPFVKYYGAPDAIRDAFTHPSGRGRVDVVMLEDDPSAAARRYPGMLEHNAKLARDGFLIVPNRQLNDPAARKAVEGFRHRFPLEYPHGVYTVFSNRPTTLTLENFADRLAELMPENPFMLPPDVLGELMKSKAALDRQSGQDAAIDDDGGMTTAEAAPSFAPRKYLIMLPILLAVYFLVRRFIPRAATMNFENGIYMGAALGACTALPLAAGMRFGWFACPVLPLAATILLLNRAVRHDGLRKLSGFVAFALAPILFEYGWLYAILCGAAFPLLKRYAQCTAGFWLLFFPLDPVAAGFAASMGCVSDVIVTQKRKRRTTGAVFLLAAALAMTVVFRLADLACPLSALAVTIVVLRLLTLWFAPAAEVRNG